MKTLRAQALMKAAKAVEGSGSDDGEGEGGGSAGDSDSANEDDDGDLLTTEVDTAVMNTLKKIRARDTAVYDPKFAPFSTSLVHARARLPSHLKHLN